MNIWVHMGEIWADKLHLLFVLYQYVGLFKFRGMTRFIFTCCSKSSQGQNHKCPSQGFTICTADDTFSFQRKECPETLTKKGRDSSSEQRCDTCCIHKAYTYPINAHPLLMSECIKSSNSGNLNHHEDLQKSSNLPSEHTAILLDLKMSCWGQIKLVLHFWILSCAIRLISFLFFCSIELIIHLTFSMNNCKYAAQCCNDSLLRCFTQSCRQPHS